MELQHSHYIVGYNLKAAVKHYNGLTVIETPFPLIATLVSFDELVKKYTAKTSISDLSLELHSIFYQM